MWGFTLIEMILVVTVIIILALIAIPSYTKSKQRSIQKEAISNLKLMAAGEKIYRMESDPPAYTACNCSDAVNCSNPTGCNTLLKLMLNTTHWTYSADVSGTLTATSVASATGMSGCVYTLTAAAYDDEPTKGGSCP